MKEEKYSQIYEKQARNPKCKYEQEAEWKTDGITYREIRKEFRITQKQIAERIGCCTKVISRFEHGKKLKWRKVIFTGYIRALEYFIFLCPKVNKDF